MQYGWFSQGYSIKKNTFVAENQFTTGEFAVPEKTNEITAIPELLDIVDVEGGIVTIDAMGCQKKIVKKIRKQKADDVIALKGNQGEFHMVKSAVYKTGGKRDR